MNSEMLAHLLQNNHAAFIHQLSTLSDDEFVFAPENKWSAAQQLDHIIRSVAPVNMALGLPAVVSKLLFGVANRPSRSYEQLIEKYKLKLTEGGRASGRFVPAVTSADQKNKLFKKLSSLVRRLAGKTNRLSEEALDKYILPHPLLGKLTLREMLYFTAYHVQHHSELVARGLRDR